MLADFSCLSRVDNMLRLRRRGRREDEVFCAAALLGSDGRRKFTSPPALCTELSTLCSTELVLCSLLPRSIAQGVSLLLCYQDLIWWICWWAVQKWLREYDRVGFIRQSQLIVNRRSWLWKNKHSPGCIVGVSRYAMQLKKKQKNTDKNRDLAKATFGAKPGF